MQFHGLSALLLSLFVAFVCAQAETSTTTFTSTSTQTRTITVSEVVASVTSTFSSYNTSVVAPTSVGTTVATGTGKLPSSAAPSSAVPSNFVAAAPTVQAGGVGIMGLFAMAVVAMLQEA
ncbi:hypothetical protein ACMFMG_001867 [Clarireedia jacksonii]